jgi:hypothetical protein
MVQVGSPCSAQAAARSQIEPFFTGLVIDRADDRRRNEAVRRGMLVPQQWHQRTQRRQERSRGGREPC